MLGVIFAQNRLVLKKIDWLGENMSILKAQSLFMRHFSKDDLFVVYRQEDVADEAKSIGLRPLRDDFNVGNWLAGVAASSGYSGKEFITLDCNSLFAPDAVHDISANIGKGNTVVISQRDSTLRPHYTLLLWNIEKQWTADNTKYPLGSFISTGLHIWSTRDFQLTPRPLFSPRLEEEDLIEAMLRNKTPLNAFITSKWLDLKNGDMLGGLLVE